MQIVDSGDVIVSAARRPIIHVESPLRPQPGDPGWPKHLAAKDTSPGTLDDGIEHTTCEAAAFGANQRFAKDVCLTIALAGGLPQCPHIFFPLFLDDFDEKQRRIGLDAGIQLQRVADEVWFCLPPWRTDFSSGMNEGMERALALGIPCIMAQHVGPHRIGDVQFPTKFHYHVNRLQAGNFDLRHAA